MNYFLGIDLSCYTTSCAVTDEAGRIVYDGRRLLEVQAGERGLRQSDMVFQHARNLPEIFPEGFSHIRAVAASVRPRPVEGSYMPVFLAAQSFGEVAARMAGAAFYPLTHQHGHIGAALYGNSLPGTFLALHVSGGTTDVLRVQTEGGVIREIAHLGGSTDIAAGQLIDRVGQALGYSFPMGPKVEAEAGGEPLVLKSSVKGLEVSFSGAETAAKNMLKQGVGADVICRSVLKCVAKSLDKLIVNAFARTGIRDVLAFGGVLCNVYIREFLKRRHDGGIAFASLQYSSDNACGLALQAREIYRNRREQ